MLSEQELGFEQASPGIVVAPSDWTVGAPSERLPAGGRGRARHRSDAQPARLPVGLRHRPRGSGGGRPAAGPAAARRAARVAALRPPQAIAVEIADPDLCARYGARVIRGVTVGDSPVWLKARLTQAGMRPINNVVDVTNYVMLAVGQPLHAFDAAKIRGGRLVARRARAGERIVTLDGIDRALQPDNLVIADTERALVIAGVFGAVDAEVDEATTDLVLEAATFDGPNIMRTSKEVGWRSEASARFEKGLDPCYVPPGLTMASRLFYELCGGAVAPGVVDVWGERAPGAAPPALPPERLRRAARARRGAGRTGRHPAASRVRRAGQRSAGRRGRPRGHAATLPARPRAARRPGRRDRPHPRPAEPARDAAPASRGGRAADARTAGAPGRRRLAVRRRPRRGRGLLVHRPRGARQAWPGRRRPARRAGRPDQSHERRAVRHAHPAAAGAAGRGGHQPRPPGRARRRVRARPRVPAVECRRGSWVRAGICARAGASPGPQGHPAALARRRARDGRHRAVRPGRGPRAGRARRGSPTSTRSRASSSVCSPASRSPARLSSAPPNRSCTPASRPTCCSATNAWATSACCVPTWPCGSP